MSNLNPATMITRVGEQVSTEVDDKVVLLQLGSGKYYALNTVGTLIWSQLSEPRPVKSLAEAVVAEYEIDYELALKDVLALIESLKEAGFVDEQAADAPA